MRPIQLVMQAFGPYSKKELIDFKQLGDNTLFLITGPTGSGKTTIFDAICFALYGETSGNVRLPEQLRSQFSDPDILTEVMLDFELKGISYHIHRIPKQDKPKSRGEGFTEQKSEATLITDTKGQRKTYTGVLQVNQQIETIIGINAEQFRQIMMIPQGEFQKLLNADSQEREKVLRKLFDTQLYRMFQQTIDERSKELYGQIKSIQQLRQHELKRIDCGTDILLLNLLKQEPLNINAIIENTQGIINQEYEETQKLSEQIQKMEKKVEKIIRNREQAKENNGKLNRLQKIREQLNQLYKDQAQIVLLEKDIEAANQAEHIRPIEENWKQRKRDVENLQKIQETLQDKLEKIDEEFSSLQEELDLLQSESKEVERERKNKELIRLQNYTKFVGQFQIIEKNIEKIEGERQKLEKEKDRLADIYVKNNAYIKLLNQEKEQGANAKIKILEIRDAIAQKEERVKNYRQLKQWLVSEEKLQDEYLYEQKQKEDNLKQLRVAEKTYKKQRLSFLMNQAALLARDLEEGLPCPVCGSTEHIQLARPSENMVTEDALNQCEKTLDNIRKQQQIFEKQCVSKKEQLVSCREKIQHMLDEILHMKKLDVESIEEKINIIEGEKIKLQISFSEQEKIVASTAQHDQRIEDLNKVQSNYEEESKKIETKWLSIHQEIAQEQSRLNQICEELPELYREKDILESAIESVEEWIAKDRKKLLMVVKAHEAMKEKHINARTMLSEHQKRIEDEQNYTTKFYNEFVKQIEDKGFESIDAYESSKLSTVEKKGKEERVLQYKKELDALSSQEAAYKEETNNIKRVDLEAYEEELKDCKKQRLVFEQQYNDRKYRYVHNEKILELVKEYQAKIEKKESKYAVLGQLAQVAQGNNPMRLSFERYVLAAFLEDVLNAANMRLKKMTLGRYILHRSDALERKNRQSGLELQVFDNYTGKMRHVKTLSGGESFKTSLAMALGLSDVVQSYTGGIQLDTMFVDEGFGTLDQESLDSAIDCLVDLQKSGRLIGIISHVQELKERIESRLEVYATLTGSRTEFV